jgi:hypothetical protein
MHLSSLVTKMKRASIMGSVAGRHEKRRFVYMSLMSGYGHQQNYQYRQGRDDNTPAQVFLGQVKATNRHTSKSIQEDEYSKEIKSIASPQPFCFPSPVEFLMVWKS